MKVWIQTACRASVVRRAVSYSLIVGPILIGINHYDAIFLGDLPAGRLWKMGLTMLVPYLVSTCSSVEALRKAEKTSEAPEGE